MVKKSGVIKAILGASFLLTLTLILLYLYFNAPSLYKQDTDEWQKRLLIYLITFSVTISVGLVTAPNVIRKLASVDYFKAFGLKFIPSALLSTAFLFLLTGIIRGGNFFNPLNAIAYLSASVLIFHLFVVSQVEEIVFRGVLFESIIKRGGSLRTAYILTAFIFAGFHYFASSGSLLVMATYIPLSLSWTYLKLNGYPGLNKVFPKLFSGTRYTQQSNAGSHFSWNMFIIGLIKP